MKQNENVQIKGHEKLDKLNRFTGMSIIQDGNNYLFKIGKFQKRKNLQTQKQVDFWCGFFQDVYEIQPKQFETNLHYIFNSKHLGYHTSISFNKGSSEPVVKVKYVKHNGEEIRGYNQTESTVLLCYFNAIHVLQEKLIRETIPTINPGFLIENTYLKKCNDSPSFEVASKDKQINELKDRVRHMGATLDMFYEESIDDSKNEVDYQFTQDIFRVKGRGRPFHPNITGDVGLEIIYNYTHGDNNKNYTLCAEEEIPSQSLTNFIIAFDEGRLNNALEFMYKRDDYWYGPFQAKHSLETVLNKGDCDVVC